MNQDPTKFFFELTPERILDAVETAGVISTGRLLQLNSMENRVYEVEIETEDPPPKNPSERFRIIKFYRPGRWSLEQIKEEHQFLLDLVEHEIPAVAPIMLAGGETVATIAGVDISFAIFPKVGGRIPDELDSQQLAQVGRLLGRMHLVGRSRTAKHRLKLTPETYARDNLKFLLEANQLPVSIKNTYVDSVNKLCDLCAPLFEGVHTQRIHGDCHYGNLIWGSAGPFWVDFDDMVVGPQIQDLWLLLPGRDEEARGLFENLLSGYEQMCEFDRRTLRLIEPLRALRFIHYATWVAKRWHDPAFQRTFINFGTESYWQEQLADLNEVISQIN